MKIAIDISPLQSGHNVRGVGFYLDRLKSALITYFPQHNYAFFVDKSEIPSDIDIVHYPYFDPFQLTIPKKSKHKVVVTVHDLTPLVFPEHFPAGVKGKLRWMVQKRRLRGVDAVITDSHAAKKDILRLTGLHSSTVHPIHLAAGDAFIHLPVHDKEKEEIRKKYRLPEKFMLYVGDVTWNKNVPRLVEAAKRLQIPFAMAGKALAQEHFDKSNRWNADLVKVQELVKEEKNIVLLGFVPTQDLVILYNTASVFVWPSVYEGFGLPILEAMQSGCPVITSREGCMPEVAGEAAYYFDGYDTASLADAINKVFTSQHLQKELREKGLVQAKKFTWEKTAQKTISVYERIMIQ